MNKILLKGNNGLYYFAKETQDGLNLESNLCYNINAKETIPFRPVFKFGSDGIDLGIREYIHQKYREYEEETGKHLVNEEDIGRRNLQMTIEGLEKIAKENKANFVLIDNLCSKNMTTYWDISGRAQLLRYKK